MLISEPNDLKNDLAVNRLLSFYLARRDSKIRRKYDGRYNSLWNRPYGLAAIIYAFQDKFNSPRIVVARQLTANPSSFAQWLIESDERELAELKVKLKNYPGWGKVAFRYISTCWVVARCDSQLTINLKPGTPDGINKLRVLRDRAKAMDRLASAKNERMLWVYDDDSHSGNNSNRPYKGHVHVYAMGWLLKQAREHYILDPLVTKYTRITGIVPVSRPTLMDGIVSWPPAKKRSTKAGFNNTLDYAAAKVTGYTTVHNGANLLRARSQHAHVRSQFASFKGGHYRHWGCCGFRAP